MQEGEHSTAGGGASKGRLDRNLPPLQGGFPSNDHDSFSVTPLLTKVRIICACVVTMKVHL